MVSKTELVLSIPLRLQGDDPTASVPASLFEEGKEWSKAWTTVSSEYNDKFGTQQVPSSFKLESQVGAFAQKFSVTDKAMRDQGRMSIEFLYTSPRTGKTEKVKRFLPMYESRMHDELLHVNGSPNALRTQANQARS
jgi:hypothetical protein